MMVVQMRMMTAFRELSKLRQNVDESADDIWQPRGSWERAPCSYEIRIISIHLLLLLLLLVFVTFYDDVKKEEASFI
jgi:hypothetical protein